MTQPIRYSRVKEFFFTFEFFVSNFRMDLHAGYCIADGIPNEDYKVVGVYLIPERRSVCVQIEHPSFLEVEEGDPIPRAYPKFKDCELNLSKKRKKEAIK